MIWNYDHFSRRNIKFGRIYILKWFIFIQKELTQIMYIIGGIVHIKKNTLQKSFKNSFLWKNQNVHKGSICDWVLCQSWLIWLWLHPLVLSFYIVSSPLLLRFAIFSQHKMRLQNIILNKKWSFFPSS